MFEPHGGCREFWLQLKMGKVSEKHFSASSTLALAEVSLCHALCSGDSSE